MGLKTIKNDILFNRAEKLLVGGVNSPVRSFSYGGGRPLLISRGKGCRVYDYDGNSYIDYVLSYGAAILGHADTQVVRSIEKAAAQGLHFGATHLTEIELARLIQKAVPAAEKIRFTNSGTEAVMGALRLSRGYTGRDKIVKFAKAYHGHADYLLARAGSGLASLSMPFSKGVPDDFIKYTIVAEYGDKRLIDDIFKRYGREIAGVVVEPVGGNWGVVKPDKDFMRHLRKVTQRYGSLLVFDEVITGFRFGFGSVSDILKVNPDLICLGKIIGGGLPIGAYAGKAAIMDNLAPLGQVYQASTFAGNPLVMQSGIATFKRLASLKERYPRLAEFTKALSFSMERSAKRYKVGLNVVHYGGMFSLKFEKRDDFARFHSRTLKAGIYFAPSEHEANFLSFAHTRKDIDLTQNRVEEVLKEMAKG